MKAVRLHAPGDLRVEEIEVPKINDHQVLIRVRAVGVCGSDPARVMKKGTYSYPMTIGHEFSGEVVEVGRNVHGYRSGDRVTVAPLIPCKKCDYCKWVNTTFARIIVTTAHGLMGRWPNTWR